MLFQKKFFKKSIILNLLFVSSVLFFQTCSGDDNNPVAPPGDNSIISKLDTIINVDNSDAIITYQNNVNITIPQGTVSGDTKLTIAKLNDNSVPDDEEMEFPNVYEITLGDQHIFDEPLEITLKYDPQKLNEGKLKYKIGASYYDETLKRWILFQDVSVDSIENTVSFTTSHLTKLSWWKFKSILGYTDYITSPHFIVYWTDGKVPSNTDYKSSLSNHKGTAPYYVQDILYYLEEARQVYEDKKLTVPKDTTNKAEVRILELPKGVDGNTSYFGFIRISQNIKADNEFSQEELVKITCAHELLHYVQDYYYMFTFEGNIIKWWLEATAVQADRIVWPNKSKFEAISYADGNIDGQLHRSWDDCNEDPNYYFAGGFLTYLTTYRDGPKLSIPKIIIESGKATNVSYFRTILNDYLKNNLSSHGIGHEYRDYVKWAYEHKGPIKIKYIPPLSSTNNNYVVPVRLTETDPSWKGTVPVSNLSAKMVKIISPTSQGATSFKIVLNNSDTQIEHYVYVSDKDKTTYKKYLVKNDTLMINLESKNQWIDILSCNIFKDDAGSFDMSVELVQAPTITSITPSTASVGDVVQIKGNNFGTNSSSGEVWFGAVKALASDIVSWLDNQIDVKVPEGAVTADVHIVAGGEKSNDVSFSVTGAPIITDIIDYLYNRDFQGIHRFTLPNNTAEIIGQNFDDYPQIRKVYVNNIEAEVYNWSDTLVEFKLPEQPTGNITIKLVTSNGESNEFPYFNGLPVSYLNSSESILIDAQFDVKFYNAKGDMNDSFSAGTRPQEFNKNNFSWNDRVLTVDLNSVENISGTISYTFKNNGLEIEKVEVNYTRSNSWPNEIVHYIGNNFPYSETNNWHGNETTFYSFGSCGEALEQNTTSIEGSINYVDDLRADFDGIDYSSGCAFNSIYLKLTFTN
ncbi:hypothetical protein MNBD_IGNAVI01-3171 [hydrothermal vent metagenome]|uniref:IPT/TIG domain-containing protein n=1 Tax=hydrothermal vent metagenome TaxID=652676 RepID=A0A3B1CHG0_9ZZZZ